MRKHSEETRRKIREGMNKPEIKARLSQQMKERRKNMPGSKSNLGKFGSLSPNWRGGRTPLKIRIRESAKYKEWRSKIYERDNWSCQTCNKRGCKLNAHHTKEFSLIVQEFNINSIEEAYNCLDLWKLDNGVTLCEDCHNLTKRGVPKKYAKSLS